ncbi:hypothetical protein L0666_02475 [Octadecabacter sp. CECT 8868]|nr:hypothetical protein [Octadecabacter algicola]MCF2903840.1 hypothetical protein [Octadecabacter algicola]
MRDTHRIRKDSLPLSIIRHLEQQGLGWGHDLYPGSFWVKTDTRKKGR